MSFAGKTYWLIGASEGLGEALSRLLSAQGAHLVLSARNHGKLALLAAQLPNAKAVKVDVTSADSMIVAKQSAGTVDGMVYIAGAYDPMRADQWNSERVMKMFDVNLLGAVRALGEVVPEMVARNTGHLVLIGSLASYRGLPGAIGYGASKAGLMHLGENLYTDLRTTDIKVQVINPGFIETRLTSKNDFKMPQIMSAENAAKRTLKLMKSKRFAGAFPTPFKWIFILGKLLPYKVFSRMF